MSSIASFLRASYPVVVLDGALKFAFAVFDVISDVSENQLRLASVDRPTFHPRCADLMTPGMRGLFQNEWRVSEELKLIYLIMNTPRVHTHKEFGNMLRPVLKKYTSKRFSPKFFVEFVFLVAYWTLVLQMRNEWKKGVNYALELITVLTRHVQENGGFDGCCEWPTTLKMKGFDLVGLDDLAVLD